MIEFPAEVAFRHPQISVVLVPATPDSRVINVIVPNVAVIADTVLLKPLACISTITQSPIATLLGSTVAAEPEAIADAPLVPTCTAVDHATTNYPKMK